LTENQITTVAARKKMVQARAGKIQLPVIVGFAFGDGGVDENGEILIPSEKDSSLNHEFVRKPYDTCTMLDDTTCRYECTIGEDELKGEKFSEVGLYDKDGDILNIKHFSEKGKDAGMSMTFWIEDCF
jgi:hypothetical protein